MTVELLNWKNNFLQQKKKQELQKKQKTLDIIRLNFTALLNAPEMQIPVAGKEPTL